MGIYVCVYIYVCVLYICMHVYMKGQRNLHTKLIIMVSSGRQRGYYGQELQKDFILAILNFYKENVSI